MDILNLLFWREIWRWEIAVGSLPLMVCVCLNLSSSRASSMLYADRLLLKVFEQLSLLLLSLINCAGSCLVQRSCHNKLIVVLGWTILNCLIYLVPAYQWLLNLTLSGLFDDSGARSVGVTKNRSNFCLFNPIGFVVWLRIWTYNPNSASVGSSLLTHLRITVRFIGGLRVANSQDFRLSLRRSNFTHSDRVRVICLLLGMFAVNRHLSELWWLRSWLLLLPSSRVPLVHHFDLITVVWLDGRRLHKLLINWHLNIVFCSLWMILWHRCRSRAQVKVINYVGDIRHSVCSGSCVLPSRTGDTLRTNLWALLIRSLRLVRVLMDRFVWSSILWRKLPLVLVGCGLWEVLFHLYRHWSCVDLQVLPTRLNFLLFCQFLCCFITWLGDLRLVYMRFTLLGFLFFWNPWVYKRFLLLVASCCFLTFIRLFWDWLVCTDSLFLLFVHVHQNRLILLLFDTVLLFLSHFLLNRPLGLVWFSLLFCHQNGIWKVYLIVAHYTRYQQPNIVYFGHFN